MSINELIQSYPVPTFNAEEFAWYWFIIGAAIVLILGFLFYLMDGDKLDAFRWSMYLLVVIIFLGLPFGMYFNYKDVHSTSQARLEWWDEVFIKEYLPTLKEERVDVISYSINKNGTVNALLNSEKEKSVGSIGRITYYNSKNPADHGFIKAKYVEGIDEIGVRAGYYDVHINLPKT
ncbi:hypothetical protein M5X17_20610 [Paenibacillus alvei]|uniref:Uncharacterized protein n=1 Tax=Paenibacillus alvei TaxID=44250 RepID=A0ABT4GR15_PAEAL|nr:hypothetical protein [Paenibacillus alvei]MCY9543623.1 hypothetical protein [Paenibacillus alvei]MCY9736122.1 hypothetical protein [Paenibacillus alvei]MCY9759136.1 hypothetical protein [Paenibacillus alvei]MCY9770405.1 hypothetical protein [Paenibacillus alvei]MEC0084371.1 hypothetical protein [Paenibacillus alvei]